MVDERPKKDMDYERPAIESKSEIRGIMTFQGWGPGGRPGNPGKHRGLGGYR
jgi:hypothetical protein